MKGGLCSQEALEETHSGHIELGPLPEGLESQKLEDSRRGWCATEEKKSRPVSSCGVDGGRRRRRTKT